MPADHANGHHPVETLPGNGHWPPISEALLTRLDTAVRDAAPGASAAPAPVTDQVEVDYAVVRDLHRAVADELAALLREHPNAPADYRAAEGERITIRHVAGWIDAQRRFGVVPAAVEQALQEAVLAEVNGLGRLDALLRRDFDTATILGHDGVRIEERDGTISFGPPVADSDEQLVAQVQNLARRSGSTERSLSTSKPMLDMQLPDGSRLTAIYQISHRPIVVIRKHGVIDVNLDDLVTPRMSMIDPVLRDFLAAVMKARRTVMVAGEAGAGKTTFIRAMCDEIPPMEWFLVMEESRELGLHTTGRHPWAVSLETREGHGEIGRDGRRVGEIRLDDMIPMSLRANTNRVIVGEVRSREIVALLAAATTTSGSLSTIHARAPELVIDRVVELALSHREEHSVDRVYRQVAGSIDFIVYVQLIDETAIGGRKHRFVSHVLEVQPGVVDGMIRTTTVFGPGRDGRAVPLHLPEHNNHRLRRVGYDMQTLTTAHGVGAWARPLSTLVGP